MSKRYVETDRWGKDAWFTNLKPREKLVYTYLQDNCNIAGFIEISPAWMAGLIGYLPGDILESLKLLKSKVIFEDEIAFVKNFVKAQGNLYLTPKNNAHRSIITKFNEQAPRFQNNAEYCKFIDSMPFKDTILPLKKGRSSVKREVQAEMFPDAKKELKLHPIQKWLIKEDRQKVLNMKKPLTYSQCEEMQSEFSKEKIKEILTAMDNNPTLQSKNDNAYDTFCRWARKENPLEKTISSTPKIRQA